MRTGMLVAAAVLGLGAPSHVLAQIDSYRGFELWGGYGGWSGDDASTLGSGPQGGVAVFAEISDRLGFGVEGVYGSMEQDQTLTVREYAFGPVLRQAFGDRSATHVFLQARLGWTRLSSAGAAVDVKQDGISVGPEIGLEIPLSQSLRLVAAGGAQWRRYGDSHVFLGPTFEGTSGSAWRYGVRLGLAHGVVP